MTTELTTEDLERIERESSCVDYVNARDVRALVAEVRRLRAECDDLRGLLARGIEFVEESAALERRALAAEEEVKRLRASPDRAAAYELVAPDMALLDKLRAHPGVALLRETVETGLRSVRRGAFFAYDVDSNRRLQGSYELLIELLRGDDGKGGG